jgi:hypothetical protein
VVLSDSIYENECPGVGAVLDARYRGWFVRVVDKRIGRDTGHILLLYRKGNVPLIAPGPDAASTVAGPVQASRGPQASNCGPGYSGKPFLTLASRVVRRGGTLVLGAADGGCWFACRIDYVARRGRGRIRLSRPLGSVGTQSLVLSPRSARTCGRGFLVVTLVIDGRRFATRRIYLP